jgi:hypothetical protein
MGYIRKEYILDSTDILFAAQAAGHDWNQACDWTRQCDMYAQDGAGYFYIFHSKTGEDCGIPELQAVIDSILDEENLTEVKVVED